jgi:ABC-type nickel/cobalt efflux system permease component RcnA
MQQFFVLQREIYAQVSTYISQFAALGDWASLLAVLPLGILFGAAHALTPGHSKLVLASYVAGSPIGLVQALVTSITLSFTHVTMSVIIVVFSLPLISRSLTSIGQAPSLEMLSRGILILIGVWMIVGSLRVSHHHAHEGKAVGFVAGLVPCPLTLFVMTFAMSRGVPQAGLAFAVAMLIGVALTLSAVALATVFIRERVLHILQKYPHAMSRVSRALEGVAGLALLLVAVSEMT